MTIKYDSLKKLLPIFIMLICLVAIIFSINNIIALATTPTRNAMVVQEFNPPHIPQNCDTQYATNHSLLLNHYFYIYSIIIWMASIIGGKILTHGTNQFIESHPKLFSWVYIGAILIFLILALLTTLHLF
jgi:hypothetical protein